MHSLGLDVEAFKTLKKAEVCFLTSLEPIYDAYKETELDNFTAKIISSERRSYLLERANIADCNRRSEIKTLKVGAKGQSILKFVNSCEYNNFIAKLHSGFEF